MGARRSAVAAFSPIVDVAHQGMVGVEHQAVSVRQFAVERHAGLQTSLLLHAAHVFALRHEDGSRVGTESGSLDVELCFLYIGEHGGEHAAEVVAQLLVGLRGRVVGLADEVFQRVAVDAGERCLFPLLFEHVEQRRIELSVEQQYVIAFSFRGFHIGILRFGIAL